MYFLLQGSGDISSENTDHKENGFAELKSKLNQLKKEKADLQEKISNKVKDKVLGDDEVLVSLIRLKNKSSASNITLHSAERDFERERKTSRWVDRPASFHRW